MFLSRQLALPVSLFILGAALVGCTGSEPYVPPTPGSGGSTGSGGATAGSGGSGSGGTVGGSGGTVGGSGGTVAGSGGSTADAAVDRPKDAVTMEVAMEAGG